MAYIRHIFFVLSLCILLSVIETDAWFNPITIVRPLDLLYTCPCGMDGLMIRHTPGDINRTATNSRYYVETTFSPEGWFMAFTTNMQVSAIVIGGGNKDLICSLCPPETHLQDLVFLGYMGASISYLTFCANKVLDVKLTDVRVGYNKLYNWGETCAFNPSTYLVMDNQTANIHYTADYHSEEVPYYVSLDPIGNARVTNPYDVSVAITSASIFVKVPCVSSQGVLVPLEDIPMSFAPHSVTTFPFYAPLSGDLGCNCDDIVITPDMIEIVLHATSDAFCMQTSCPGPTWDLTPQQQYDLEFLHGQPPDNDANLCENITRQVCDTEISPTDAITDFCFMGPCVAVTLKIVDCNDHSIVLSPEVIISGNIALIPPFDLPSPLSLTWTSGLYVENTTVCYVSTIRKIIDVCSDNMPIQSDIDITTKQILYTCDASYDIVIAPPVLGCTRSLGYWKTHGITVKQCPFHNQNCTRVNLIDMILKKDQYGNILNVFVAGTNMYGGHAPYGIVDYSSLESQHISSTTVFAYSGYDIWDILSGSQARYMACKIGWTYIQLLKQFTTAALNIYSIQTNNAPDPVYIPDVILKDMADANIILSLYNCANWASAMTTKWPSTLITYDQRAKAIQSDLDKWNNGMWPNAQPYCSE